MDDTFTERLAALAAPIAALADPGKRIYAPFLLGALLLAAIVAWRERVPGEEPRRVLGRLREGLFDRSIWAHPSALADYRLIACKAALRAALFPGFVLSTWVVAAMVAGFVRRSFGVEVTAGTPRWLVGVGYTLVAFVVDDWSRFAVHRAMHRVPWLWEIHRVHHTAEVMTPLSLYRTHPIESAINQLRGVVAVGFVTGLAMARFGPLLGGWEVLGVDAIGFVWSLGGANLRHSHVWLSYGRRWGRWLLSPAQHQIHHSADARHRDRNFGEVLALWDRLGGSLYVTDQKESLRFGLPADDMLPQRALALLFAPLVASWRTLRSVRPQPVARALAVASLVLLSAGCQSKRFDRGALAVSLGECSLDVYRQSRVRAASLASAVEAYGAAPDASTRAAAQEAWRATMAVWQQAEMLRFGPLAGADSPGGQNLRESIYPWPSVSRCLIEQQLVAKLYEPATFAFLPAATRGLGALEFLLFHDGADNACDATVTINAQGTWAALGPAEIERRKRDYAKAAAADLVLRLDGLVGAWESSYLPELRTAGRGSTVFPSQQVAIHTVAAALFFADTDVKDLRLGVPLGLKDCATGTCPDAIESTWAKQSKSHLSANIAGIDMLLHGCQPAVTPLGFDDWLVSVGARPIAESLTADVAAVKAAIAAVPGSDLRETLVTNPTQVMAIYEAVKELTDALKQEFTVTLAIQPPKRVEGDND